MIRVRQLTKSYPGHEPIRALRGVDLDLDPGMFGAVLGPSGCGKTTLLRTLAGLERADGGTIEVGGRVLAGADVHVTPEGRRIGLVPQEGALFPHLDVAANVAFGLRSLTRRARDARVRDLLDLVGLPGFGHRRPHELSGGQQQRVALCRALAPQPDVVLLDEPFSALDTALRATIRDHVDEALRATDTMAILVTHDQDEALSFADHVAVMRDGRIIQAGAPADLYHRPTDPWTARFLGDAILLPGHRPAPAAPHVDTPLGRLELDPHAVHQPGPAVTVLVRPEQVVRTTEPDATHATVDQVRFRGGFADVILMLDSLVRDALPADGTTGDGLNLVARWTTTDLPAALTEVRIAVAGRVVAYAPVTGVADPAGAAVRAAGPTGSVPTT